jgi:uncharacterized protein (TIGR02246 family)
MKADLQTEAAMVAVLERFCAAFAARDPDAVMRLFAEDRDVVIVTSEESVLRGRAELRDFIRAYASGRVSYSWTWDRCDVSSDGGVAWLLAEGTETAAMPDGEERHAYRMTIVAVRRDDRLLLVQVHGSSPQAG